MEALTTHLSGFPVAVVLRVARYSSAFSSFARPWRIWRFFSAGGGGWSTDVLSVVSVGRLSVSRGRRLRGNGLRLLRWLLRGGRRLRRLGLRWRSGRWRSRGSNERQAGQEQEVGRGGTFGLG